MVFSIANQGEIPGAVKANITARQLGILDAQQAFNGTATEPRFTSLRIKQIMVWGASSGEGAMTLYVRQSTNSVTQGDYGSFRAFGTPGSRRPALNVRPNLLLRNQWFSTLSNTEGNEVLFFLLGAAGVDDTAVVRVTVEMR
jgi:hypothetical protein